MEDPDSKGFWTTLALWNKWRVDTYADNPEKELPFLDPLLEAKPTAVEETSTVKKVPEIKQHISTQYQWATCLSRPDPNTQFSSAIQTPYAKKKNTPKAHTFIPPSLKVWAEGPHLHWRCGPEAHTFIHWHFECQWWVCTPTGSEADVSTLGV